MRASHKASSWPAGGLVALVLLLVALLAPAAASAASGDLVWAKGIELGPAREEFTDLAKGPNGTIYAVGRANHSAGVGDVLVAKYSPQGKRLWKRVYDSLIHGDDYGVAIAVDGKGNAFVTGLSASSAHGLDALTIKYSSGGARKWVRRYNGMADAYDAGADVAVDTGGNAYVALTSTVMGGMNIVVVKYRPGGAKAFETMWAGPSGDDYAKALTVDGRGRAYVVGMAGTATAQANAVIVRLKSTGAVGWARMYNGAAGLDDVGEHVMLRGASVYLMGRSQREGGRSCLLAIRYGLTGARKWARVSDTAGSIDFVAGGWVDRYENVTVGGQLSVAGPEGTRGVAVSWNKSGVFNWENTYYTTATTEAVGYSALTGSAGGAVYCSGWADRGAAFDSLVVKYRKGGSLAWAQAFNSDPYEGADSQCLLLTGGTTGGVYSGGALSVGGASYSAVLLKYRP